MNRRGLDKVPHEKVSKKGRKVKAFIFNDTLILDCYNDKVYLGRYAIDHEGRHLLSDGSGWRKAKLPKLFGLSCEAGYYFGWGCSSESIFEDEDEELINEYFKEDRNNFYLRSAEQVIEQMESRYDKYLRNNAYKNKCRKIDAKMTGIKPLSADVDRWVKEDIYEDAEFLFWDKDKRAYYCTACKKYHYFKNVKDRQPYKCTRTEKTVIADKRNTNRQKKTTVMICQDIGDGKAVFRHFDVARIWDKYSTDEVIFFEKVRLLYEKESRNLYIYYGQFNGADELHQLWWNKNPRNNHPNGRYCYPVGVKEALAGTQYEGLGIEVMAQKGWKVEYNKIMANGYKHFEYFAKCNLEKLTLEVSKKLSILGGLDCKSCSINKDGETVQEVLDINMQRFYRLKQKNGGITYLGWLQYEEENNCKVTEEVMSWMNVNKIIPNDLRFISFRMTPVQIMNYLKRQKEECKETVKSILSTWKDYLSMANKLGFDTSDEIVYRCKKLRQRHDECVEEMQYRQDDIMITGLEQEYPDIAKIYKRIRSRYEYEDDEYMVVVPEGIRSIVMEGRALHHCVASSERYLDRIQAEESYIFFLRKKDRPLKSYYTLEVEPGGTVRQKRTEFDRQKSDIKDAEQFLKKWQQEIKKKMKEEDKVLARKSKKLRLEGFEELRKNKKVVPAGELAGTLLVDVLEADLLEAM